MERQEKLNLYLTFLSERKGLTVYSDKKNLSYLKALISDAFNIPQNVDFRLQKFHSVSKRPYTVENIDSLNSGDEITVELISAKATYVRIDHTNSQEESQFLSNDPSELNNEDLNIDHKSTSINNNHQSNHQIQNHEPTKRRFVNSTDFQSQIIDSERAPEKRKRGRPRRTVATSQLNGVSKGLKRRKTKLLAKYPNQKLCENLPLKKERSRKKLAGREKCECMASLQQLNCSIGGAIKQEGEGSCFFCGNPVFSLNPLFKERGGYGSRGRFSGGDKGPGDYGGKFDAGLPGFGIGNLDVFIPTTAKKLSPEGPRGISLNFTSLRGGAPGGRRDGEGPNEGVGAPRGFGRREAAVDRSMSRSKSRSDSGHRSRSDSGHRSRSYSHSSSHSAKSHKCKRSPKRSRSREKRCLNFVDDWKTCVQKQTNNTEKDCLKQCKICEEYFGAIEFKDHENECKNFKEKIENDEKMAIQLDRELQSELLYAQKQTNNTEKDCLKQCKICEEYFGSMDFRDHENECKNFKEKIENDKKMAIQLDRELQSELLYAQKQANNTEKDCLKQCKICEEYFGAIEFKDHENECKKFKEKIENDEKMAIQLDRELQSELLYAQKQANNTEKDCLKQCKICEEYFGAIEFKDHENECKNFKEKIENDEKMAIQLGRELQSEKLVNAMQMRALLYVQKESENKSKAAYPKLLERFQKLKYNELDLKKTLEHIRTRAQIIIHFNPANVMQFFVKDTHYRNRFEIQKVKHLGGRSEWEDRIFGNEYKTSAPVDRVKYGVLNIVNDPSGVKACLGYGDSYLALNSETVCLRTTFASGDTSGMVELASCENYAHVLATYNDNELQGVISVAIGEKICESSNKIAVYKEVQIHGPVEFKRDVVAIVVNSVHKKNISVTRNVEEFAKINNVNLIWME